MGKRKRDANRKVIPNPSDSKRRKDRNRPGRRNGSEHKRRNAQSEEVDLLVEQSGVELRRCVTCKVMKSFDSFADAAPTSIKTAYATCTHCLAKKKSARVESGESQFTLERVRIRSLSQQSKVKATLFGCEGYEEYAAVCDEA